METHSFGVWLRLKRKGLDLSRQGLADRAVCSAATIQKLEEEERRPSAELVARLADVFGVPEDQRPAFHRYARGELRSVVTDVDRDPPWHPSTQPPRSNVPQPITRLIGRRQELRDILGYLRTSDVRLVTVTGPPGIGKTRLCIRAAHESRDLFPDGTFFVSLDTLEDPSLLTLSVAHALGFVSVGNASPRELIFRGIRDKRMLVVLDNCEQQIEELAALVTSLLSDCTGLCLLATSREPIRVAGEWLYPLSGLGVPVAGSPINVSFESEPPESFSTLTLFAERARAVQPDFRLTGENVQIVAEICRRLDGLPLAIELVAARTRSMSPPALLERLDDSLSILAQGARGVPNRQRSLNQAIDWSYRLLTDGEQRLFVLLSVFPGTFTVSAAQTVVAQVFDAGAITEILLSLVDKSLVQRAPDFRNEPRYEMLTTIRGFAGQRLADADQDELARDWHLAFVLELVARADVQLRGSDQPAWLDRIDAMRDDIRSAFEWAIASDNAAAALRLAKGMWWFWSMRSEFSEGRQWLGRVLQMPGVPAFPDLQAAVLTQLAHHTLLQSGVSDARADIEQALAIARERGTPSTVANALLVTGLVRLFDAKFDAASSAFQESRSLFQEQESYWEQALALMCVGYAAVLKDDLVTALTTCEEAMIMFRSLGDQYFQSVCLYEIGALRARQGAWEIGLASVREALSTIQDLGSNYEIATGLLRLAQIEQQCGRTDRAVRLYAASRRTYDTVDALGPEDDAKFDTYMVQCQKALGHAEFASMKRDGEAMTPVQAVSYGLGEIPAS